MEETLSGDYVVARIPGRWAQALQQLWCGLRRHPFMLMYEPGRVWLRCIECGKETNGWDVSAARQDRPLADSDLPEVSA